MSIEFKNIVDVDQNLIELVRTWRNSKSVSQYMYTDHYITPEEHQKWLAKLKKEDTARAWIINYHGKPVGLAYLSNIDHKNKTTEWGFYIGDKRVRGKGIGSAALYNLIDYVFEDMKFNKMHTRVLENNPIAIKLYEKFGFIEEKRFKKQVVRDGENIKVRLMTIFCQDWEKQKEKLKGMKYR